MNLQYISDNQGFHTGVIIPIADWEALKLKYKELEEEENEKVEIPEWHKKLLDQRMESLKSNPNNVLDFDKTIEEIENEL